MSDVRRAIARLREGTEILRTGGGVKLTSAECNDQLDVLDASCAEQLRAAAARVANEEHRVVALVSPELLESAAREWSKPVEAKIEATEHFGLVELHFREPATF